MQETLSKFKLYFRMFGWPGLILAVQTRLSPGPKRVVVKPPGLIHPVHLRLKTCDVPTFRKIFVHQEYGLALRKDPRFILDLGANIGLSALYFATRYPTARIIAVEPEGDNYALLKANCAPYPNITPVRAAVWKQDTTLNLVDPDMGPWGFQIVGTSPSQGKIIDTVEGVTVETLMRRHGVDRIDLLKVDIEGSEKELFEDRPWWLEKVGVIMVELHDTLRAGSSQAVYCATRGAFDVEIAKGENIFLARSGEVAGSLVSKPA